MPVLSDEIFPPSDDEVKAVSGRKRISHYEKGYASNRRLPVSDHENPKARSDSEKKYRKR